MSKTPTVIITVTLVLALTFLTACIITDNEQTESSEANELHIAAASDLRFAFEEIGEIFKEEQSRSNYNILTAVEREYLGQLDLKEKEKGKGVDKKRLRYLNRKIAEFEEAIKRREDSIRKRHAEEVLE